MCTTILTTLTTASLLVTVPALAQGGPPAVPEGTVVHREVAYVPDGHERQRLDLYLPGEGNDFPLIIWVHGGAWLAGSKDFGVPVDYVAEGYAVASLNYRLIQHAIFPAQIEDVKAAVRFLRANAASYRLDPERFVAWGASAGGHLVALIGTSGDTEEFETETEPGISSHVRAVVDYFGPTDFLQMDAHRLPDGMPHGGADTPESRLVGGPIAEHPDRVKRANPITYVSPDDPPFLIIHGDQDPLVPHHQSVLLHAALEAAGVPVTFYTVEGGGHGGFDDPKVDELTRAFLDRHLKHAAP